MSQINSIVARLLALHPKRIDLTLVRMWRILDALGHPEPPPAAGRPYRRHQRQGLDHRVHARDPGSRQLGRARLYLAASGALQRTLSSRRRRGRTRRRTLGLRRRARRRADAMRARQCGRPDHGVRDHHRGRAAPVRAPAGRYPAARGRSRRPARRHQCDRAPARHRGGAGLARSQGIPRRYGGQDRGREGRHLQA